MLRYSLPESLDIEAWRKMLPYKGISLLLAFFLLAAALILDTPAAYSGGPSAFQGTQEVSFTSWRPYNNPNRLISIGMNKGEVIAIAGEPDREESYYRSSGGRLVRISDWYYFRTGHDPETTVLKFVEDNLVSITSTPTR